MEELNILINDIVDTTIALTILLLMFTMGLHSKLKEAFLIWRTPRTLLVYLLSVVVLVPVAAFIVLEVVPDVPVEAKVGALLLAGAAGNAMVPKLSEKLGQDVKVAASILITLCLVTMISAPLVVQLAIPPELVTVDGGAVAATILKGVVIPIFIGVAIRQWWVKAANVITDPLTKIADSMLMVVIVLIIVKDIDVILDMGLITLAVVVGLSATYMAIGHLLGGPTLGGRMQMSMFSGQRNGAVAMLVASSAVPAAIPVIVAFGIIALVMGIAYMTTVGKGLIPDEPEEDEVGTDEPPAPTETTEASATA